MLFYLMSRNPNGCDCFFMTPRSMLPVLTTLNPSLNSQPFEVNTITGIFSMEKIDALPSLPDYDTGATYLTFTSSTKRPGLLFTSVKFSPSIPPSFRKQWRPPKCEDSGRRKMRTRSF